MEILIGISLCLNIFLLVAVGLLINSLQTEKKDLLNRLMAKDYKEYAVFERAKQDIEIEERVFQEQDAFPVN